MLFTANLSVFCSVFLKITYSILYLTIVLFENKMDFSDEENHQICGVLILNESNAFVYRCRKCNCEFSTGCGLEVHFLYEHMDKSNGINNSSWDLTAKEDVFIEIDEHNLSGNENISRSPKIGKARKRNKKKTQKQNSTTVAAAKVFYCDMCPGESFSNLRSIRKHMNEVHTIENPYECDYCGATFKTDGRRLAHQRKHTNEPQPFKHQCTECERHPFRTPGELQQHFHSIHSFIRPYICDLCGKTYSSKQYIRLHLQSHGEKRFECKYCAKKFKTNANKRGHERKIHETSNTQRLEIEFN